MGKPVCRFSMLYPAGLTVAQHIQYNLQEEKRINTRFQEREN